MKETMKHTPEPWDLHPENASLIYGDGGTERVGMTNPFADRFGARDQSAPIERANAARIVACVNACKGIEDPEKTIRELVEALRDHHSGMNTTRPFAETFERDKALLAKLEGGAK